MEKETIVKETRNIVYVVDEKGQFRKKIKPKVSKAEQEALRMPACCVKLHRITEADIQRENAKIRRDTKIQAVKNEMKSLPILKVAQAISLILNNEPELDYTENFDTVYKLMTNQTLKMLHAFVFEKEAESKVGNDLSNDDKTIKRDAEGKGDSLVRTHQSVMSNGPLFLYDWFGWNYKRATTTVKGLIAATPNNIASNSIQTVSQSGLIDWFQSDWSYSFKIFLGTNEDGGQVSLLLTKEAFLSIASLFIGSSQDRSDDNVERATLTEIETEEELPTHNVSISKVDNVAKAPKALNNIASNSTQTVFQSGLIDWFQSDWSYSFKIILGTNEDGGQVSLLLTKEAFLSIASLFIGTSQDRSDDNVERATLTEIETEEELPTHNVAISKANHVAKALDFKPEQESHDLHEYESDEDADFSTATDDCNSTSNDADYEKDSDNSDSWGQPLSPTALDVALKDLYHKHD